MLSISFGWLTVARIIHLQIEWQMKISGHDIKGMEKNEMKRKIKETE